MTTENSSTRERVLIVGAGFASFECARRLPHLLAKDPRNQTEVILVSTHDYMLYTPLLPDVAGGILDPRYVSVPLAGSLPGVELITGRVTSVNFDSRTITLIDCDADVAQLHWDRLVLTPGSVTRTVDIPVLKENACGLKTVGEALYLRDQLLTQLELSTHETDPVQREAQRTVVVVGASYAGTELVAQLRALADEVARQRRFDPTQVRFLLLDRADRVMPELGEKLGRQVLEVLRRRGIEVRLGTTLDALTGEHVVLSNGTTIPTRTVVWVTGVTASPLISTLDLPLTEGRLIVQPDLSVPGAPDVFAAGDAAAVPDLKNPGNITPPTAQHAVRQGHLLARNVASSLGMGRPAPYRHRNMGLVVDLGPRFAVANPLGINLSGLPAKIVTRLYHLYALPRTANRFAAATAYLLEMVAPRPLVSFGLASAEETRFAAQDQ
ncbi:NAD(P)/FAD-dependent oxidoreductase [Rhodococcus opacus]|uniref:NAD(P)/FAD-dependent oxidoreductase n=1 Tax=Rhodococcus opacus TaxID=37919 RepID=UPI001F593D02|nr:NAD(P)/FAD-dependent oxidoreductase [Rhodococcus opacus]UNN01556.1 NAD(P)/FAD-dependent oxidoreductase [Rhodococcus opacus]